MKEDRVSRRSKRQTVRLIPPESPAARDEGPRLIPLDHVRRDEPLALEHLIDLAETSLASAKKKSAKQLPHIAAGSQKKKSPNKQRA